MERIHRFLTPFDLPLLLLAASALFALRPAYDLALAWPALGALLAGCLLALAAPRLLRAPDGPRWLAQVMAALGGLAALYLLAQHTHDPALDKVAAISRLSAWLGRVTPRLGNWSPQGNSMAAFVEGLLFLAVALSCTERRHAWRWVWRAAAGAMTLALLLSESRGAWLAVALAGLVWLALYQRWGRWLAGLVGLGALGLGLAVWLAGDVQVLARIPLVDRTLAPLFIRPDRLEVYRGSLSLIEDAPFSGIGLGGQFAMVYSHFYLLIQVPFLTYSHNLFLEAWLELGLAGFLALIWLLAAAVWGGVAAAQQGSDLGYESSWIGLLAIALHGLTDARAFVDLWCWLPFFLLVALAGAWHRGRPPAGGRMAWWGPAALALAALALAAASLPLDAAAWQADQGAQAQARAELAPGLSEGEHEALRAQAAARFRRAIELRPAQRSAYTRLGLLELQAMDFTAALRELRQAYVAAPGNAATRKALGLAMAWSGDAAGAAGLLAGAPGIVSEMNTWGWWWAQQERVDLAAQAYQVSLLLSPDQADIRQALDTLEVQP